MQKSLYSKLSIKEARETFLEFQIEFVIVLMMMMMTSFLIYFLTQYIIVEKGNVIDYNVFLLTRQFMNPAGLKAAEFLSILGTGSFLVPAYIFIVIY